MKITRQLALVWFVIAMASSALSAEGDVDPVVDPLTTPNPTTPVTPNSPYDLSANLRQNAPGVGVRLPTTSQDSPLRKSSYFSEMLDRAKSHNFVMRMGNAAIGNSPLTEHSLNRRIKSYCSHLVKGSPQGEAPEGCTLDGLSTLDRCDLGGVITTNEDHRITRFIPIWGNDAQKNCEEEFKSILGSRLMVEGTMAEDAIVAATNLTGSQISLENNSAQTACVNKVADESNPIKNCDDFNDSPIAGNALTGIMSRFITGFNGFGGFAKLLRFNSTTSECKSCFGEKYKIHQQLHNQPADDYVAQYDKKIAEAKINFRVRKAEQALSEYIKFQERNMFMSRYMSAQPETCLNSNAFNALPSGCSSVQASEVLKKLSERHKVRLDPKNINGFLHDLRKKHISGLEAEVKVSDCENRSVTHSGFLSAFQTQISNGVMLPSRLFNTQVRADLKNCGEYDQKCMIDVLVQAESTKNGGDSSKARTSITSFFRQPFYRSLLSNRDSLLDYADSGDISNLNNLSQYKNANKDRFAEISRRDSEVACRSINNDFMTALCVKDVELGGTYSGQGLKEELADMLMVSSEPPRPDDTSKNLVNLSVACNMFSMTNNLATEINESKIISDISFDRHDLADSFHRLKIREPSRLSQKKQSYIESYANKICQGALKQQQEEQDKLDRENFMSNMSRPSYIFDPECSGPLNILKPICAAARLHDFGLSLAPNVSYSPMPSRASSSLGLYKDNTSRRLTNDWSFESGLEDASSERFNLGFATASSASSSAIIKQQEKYRLAEETSSGGLLEATAQIGSQLSNTFSTSSLGVNQGWVAPTSIPESSVVGRGLASTVDSDEDPGLIDRRSSTSERSIQEIEARQTLVEQQVLAQAKETQTIQDLKNQAQIEQLRIELQKLQLSNKQLMTNIQKLSGPRKTQSEENMFDQSFDEEEETFEVSDPAPTRPVSRGVTQSNLVKPEGATTARSGIDSSTVTTAATRLPEQSRGDKPAATTSTAAVAANVGAVRGGTQAAANRGVAAASSGVSFVPSMSLQRTITSETTQEVIPQEKKIELLKEFLSYVEKNPEYKDGRYLSSENDRVTIEYEGRTVILSVTDIQDNKARSHLQERLLRQRMVINQYVRASRLENLKRLLASTRAQQ